MAKFSNEYILILDASSGVGTKVRRVLTHPCQENN